MGPSQAFSSQSNLIVPKRVTVTTCGTGFIGGTVTNAGLATYNTRPRVLLRRYQGSFYGSWVVTIDVVLDMPVISSKSFRCVIGKPSIDLPINGNTIIIIDAYQFGKLKCPRKRSSFMRNTFHQTAITRKDISKVINDLEVC